MKRTLPGIVLIAAALLGYAWFDGSSEAARTSGHGDARGEVPVGERTTQRGERDTGSASAEHARHGQLEGSGIVVKILADDNDGSRHQRFILRRESGQTVLVAHNIDVAPRIPALKRGDTVVFFGEFEANAKGGVVHWTHRDPAGRHVAGWLKHNGRTYQ